MSAITTHVLDASRGCPAAGVPVVLERLGSGGQWIVVGRGVTDADGRERTLMGPPGTLVPGIYRIVFDTGAYFAAQQVRTFYPHVTVTFEAAAGHAQYHIPLLVSPFGYTTYRGS
jgi:5-hydroxyisourate hydrolase